MAKQLGSAIPFLPFTSSLLLLIRIALGLKSGEGQKLCRNMEIHGELETSSFHFPRIPSRHFLVFLGLPIINGVPTNVNDLLSSPRLL